MTQPVLQVVEGIRVIDAEGLYVMPGGIDPHTHLEMPFMGQIACDDFFSGQVRYLALASLCFKAMNQGCCLGRWHNDAH